MLNVSKTRKCKCGTEYEQYTSLQNKCIPCAIKAGRAKDKRAQRTKEKNRRKDTRERKSALKTLSDWLGEAQSACNAWIRYRDRDKPCISCGTLKQDIQYCAGHYKTRGGHPELRFHPDNIHKQCNKNCNLKLSGNIANYRPRLIERIGIDSVEWLEGPHHAQNLTIDDAKEIKAYYKDQLKLLKQGY